MQLWHKVTIGLILGIVFGALLPQYAKMFKPLGDVFLRGIMMIIPFLIFFSIVSGITSLSNNRALGRIGTKATIAYLVSTFFAVGFGLIIGSITKPGKGIIINLTGTNLTSRPTSKEFSIIDLLVEIVPNNALKAMVDGNAIQIVFISLFIGIVINKMGSSANNLKLLFQQLLKLFMKMASLIIKISPYAAFSLMAFVVSTQGLGILIALSKLMAAVIIAIILQYLFLGIMILVFAKISPIPFYKKSVEYQMIALSTSSSKMSLPTSMDVCKRKLGISETSTSFILPLGASINMDGLAINLSLTAIFFAQLVGVELQPYEYMLLILTATLGSIGGAGIPGAALIMLPMVLTSINLPIEGVAIIAGIDRILDMFRSAINITGDVAITLIIDTREGYLDVERYYKA